MSILDKITQGRIEKPPKLLVWGPPAVGKSTFAAGAPKALFIEAEDRTCHLDVHRVQLEKWEDVFDIMLAAGRGELDYETLVFDTIDAMELLLFKFIADEAGKDSHDEIGGGYFKFRSPMLRQWKRLMNGVDRLTHKGIQCILLAHAQTKTYHPPDGESYDRFVIKMDQVGGDFIVENVDLVGYAKFKTFVKERDNDKRKSRATTSGKRELEFKFNPAFPTKQGIPCKERVPLTWEAFKEGLG